MQGQEAAVYPHYRPQPQAMRHRLTHVRSVPPRTSNPLPTSLGGPRSGAQVSLRKQPSLDTPTKIAIQPSVCGVQPGRLLSLRTTLGLRQARAIIAQQQEIQLQTPVPADSASGNSRAQLKQARLQPLGVVGSDTIHPEEFLGVVPVTSLRGRSDHRRPKSCTAPGTQINCLQEDHAHRQVSNAVKTRKRSYSAVLPRNIPDQILRQLLSVSRHMALPPQQEGTTEHAQNSSVVDTVVTDTSQAEFIRVKMRGLKRNSPRDGTKPNHSPKHGRGKTPATSSQIGKLPSISDPPSTREGEDETNTSLSITVTRTRSARIQEESDPQHEGAIQHSDVNHTTTPTPPDHPHGVGGVSIRDGKGVGVRINSHKTRQHPRKGRLSQGWSPPQPIQPLKGSPIHTPPRGLGVVKERGGPKVPSEPAPLSPTASMTISVNVNEFLTQTDTEEN